MAQVVECAVLTSEIRGLNLAIGNYYFLPTEFEKTKIKIKETGTVQLGNKSF